MIYLERERDTVLAALRLWQRQERVDADLNTIARNGRPDLPACRAALTDDEIDELCERLTDTDPDELAHPQIKELSDEIDGIVGKVEDYLRSVGLTRQPAADPDLRALQDLLP